MLDMNVMFDLSYGIYLITGHEGDKDGGCLVNTVTQLTAEPIQCGVSVSKHNYTHDLLKNGKTIGVTVMAQEADSKLLGTFGYKSGHNNIDKFSGTPCHKGTLGNYLIDSGDIAQMEGKIIQAVDMDTHTFFIFTIEEGEKTKEQPPLTYQYYREVKKLKSSRYAPTFQAMK